MEVLISNRQKKIKLNLSRIRTIAQEIMKFEGISQNAELSVVFCDDDFIQKLNHQYLGHNRPTDVLSFPMEESEFEHETVLIGDVVISIETAIRQAEKLRHSVGLEIVFLLTHGLLHLFGYDHKRKLDLTRMKKREETICALLSEKKFLKDLESAKSVPLIKRATDSKNIELEDRDSDGENIHNDEKN
ncbi:MAG: rRNA maturation RNase YbeY [Candidatus Riflebacteria bacterium]|nr:rRNA maturation RNase YbeY [Candidatus Riflebacteria bacterium]